MLLLSDSLYRIASEGDDNYVMNKTQCDLFDIKKDIGVYVGAWIFRGAAENTNVIIMI